LWGDITDFGELAHAKWMLRVRIHGPSGHLLLPRAWVAGAAPTTSPRSVGGRYNCAERVEEAHMNESIVEMQRLLKEVVSHLQADTKPDKRKAGAKLERMASLASTLAQMLQAQR
jgi:hypothetical protein